MAQRIVHWPRHREYWGKLANANNFIKNPDRTYQHTIYNLLYDGDNMFSFIQSHTLTTCVRTCAVVPRVFSLHTFREREESFVQDPFESKSISFYENNSPCKKKKRLSLSLSKNRERFLVCTAEDVEAASKKKVPKNTLTAVNWAFQVFEDWVTLFSYVYG